MLHEARQIRHDNRTVCKTPLLVPSFSSKGFPDFKSLIAFSQEFITETFLVSAYDIHHHELDINEIELPELLFVDSGGYEASKDHEHSDPKATEVHPLPWTQEQLSDTYQSICDDLPQPAVLVSYDHPSNRKSISEQIRAAAETLSFDGHVNEILIKPTSLDSPIIDVADVITHLEAIAEFDIVGFTEKELGNSFNERVANVAKIRCALKQVGANNPIHIFGSLDPVATTTYCIAGADIFDGLTWLRYKYLNGISVSLWDHGALTLSHDLTTNEMFALIRSQNLYYLADLQQQLRDFVETNNSDSFKQNAEFFKSVKKTISSQYGEEFNG